MVARTHTLNLPHSLSLREIQNGTTCAYPFANLVPDKRSQSHLNKVWISGSWQARKTRWDHALEGVAQNHVQAQAHRVPPKWIGARWERRLPLCTHFCATISSFTARNASPFKCRFKKKAQALGEDRKDCTGSWRLAFLVDWGTRSRDTASRWQTHCGPRKLPGGHPGFHYSAAGAGWSRNWRRLRRFPSQL